MSLKIVHESDNYKVDIIAVHGLNFNNSPSIGTTTWERDGKVWVKDFLPWSLSIPSRIMLFEYNSSPAVGSTGLKLDDHAKKLLSLLDLRRRNVSADCIIMFVCHSMGGLLVKEALVEATLDASYREILEATRLLVFFGTPHQGGNHASVGEIATKMYRTFSRNSRNDFMEALKMDSNSATKRFEQFRHQLEDFLVVSCYESTALHRVTGLIVDKRSATLGLPGNREKQIGLERDHSAICKFSSAEDNDCELVMGTISAQLDAAIRSADTTRTSSRNITQN